jgi:glycerol transport system substrate-binding protein
MDLMDSRSPCKITTYKNGGIMKEKKCFYSARAIKLAAFLFAMSCCFAWQSFADIEAAKKWLAEFSPSTLSQEQQLKELEWFIEAAKPFKGMNIKVVSETIDTHSYESKVLAKAFSEITGIQLTHDLIQEGDVIEKLQTQMQTGRSIYDMYVNDSDLIGTHFRYGYVVPLSDFIKGEGKDVTLPTLDIDDFMGISFTTGPDGKIYQLPDQQFANLYWFRYDWFKRPELKKKNSRNFMAMNSAFRSIGQHMRISPTFLPTR